MPEGFRNGKPFWELRTRVKKKFECTEKERAEAMKLYRRKNPQERMGHIVVIRVKRTSSSSFPAT